MSEKRILKMVPPNDIRLLSKIAPYQDDMLKEHDFENRKALAEAMYDTMKKYGGLGLSCNQVGLPYRMFVMGGHPEIDLGRTRYVFNPEVLEMSKESVMLKEGCLSFPFVFVSIRRPKWVQVKYEDEEGETKQETLHGMNARIFQHENEQMEKSKRKSKKRNKQDTEKTKEWQNDPLKNIFM